MRGGDHGELAARNVAADRLHGDVLVAKDHAGEGLDLDIKHGVPLCLGEVANLGLSEFKIRHFLRGDLCDDLFDLGVREAVCLAVISVKLVGQLTHGHITACLDVF